MDSGHRYGNDVMTTTTTMNDSSVIGTTNNNNGRLRWRLFGAQFPSEQIKYISQVVLIYIIVVAAVTNLSLKFLGDVEEKIWLSLLWACIGLLMPSPTLTNGKKLLNNNDEFLRGSPQ